MASKKKKPSERQTKLANTFSNLNPALKSLAGGDEDIYGGFKAGGSLASSFFAPGSLGRVTELPDNYLLNNIGAIQNQFNAAQVRTPEAASRLAQLQGLFTKAQQLTPEEQQVLDLRKANLSGLSQEEEQYLKDTGQRGLNRALQTSLGGLRAKFSGATGRSATLAAQPTMQSFADATRQLLADVGKEKIDRSRQALDAYDSTVGNTNAALSSRSLNAGQLFSNAGLSQDQFEAQNRLQLGQQLTGLQSQVRDDIMRRQLFNYQQQANERAGQLGLIFGGGQFASATQGRKTGEDIARQAIEKTASITPFDFSAFIPQVASPDTYGAEA